MRYKTQSSCSEGLKNTFGLMVKKKVILGVSCYPLPVAYSKRVVYIRCIGLLNWLVKVKQEKCYFIGIAEHLVPVAKGCQGHLVSKGECCF